eukprot:CCRYP_011531-RA/>CCRYP_011531-RA protein AED:0.43 eAED:0.43 QI:0/0/0/1/1/1/2/0/350
MASATEAELAALYIMAREAVFIRIALEELGHTQPATPLQMDNSTAEGIVNGKFQPKQTKAMDMQFHWLRDREYTFDDFPNSLISVGCLADNNTVSIFTQDGVTVHNEHDVLITCRGDPVLIPVPGEHRCYRVPLIQTKGQWQPHLPKKRVTAKLYEANNVYDLPLFEHAIQWMHAVCRYPVKSTWLKAVKAGNFIGWPFLTEKHIAKYFPNTLETQQGHMAQTCKNMRSTKRSSQAFASPNTVPLQAKKVCDLYTTIYDVCETTFSDQTGHFPTQSQWGNKYVMVMVEIDSNAILLELMKRRQDHEMIRVYKALTHCLLRAGIQPKKHVLNNKISSNMKEHIRSKYNFTF